MKKARNSNPAVKRKKKGGDSNFATRSKKKTGTSILFVSSANQILLFLRDNKKSIPFPNCWDILGGNVEVGETPLECITREMEEEIGMKLENPILFSVYDMNDRVEYTFWQRADFDIRKIDLKEGRRLKWFTEKGIDRLTDKKLAFGFKSIILDFFRQKPFEADRDLNAVQQAILPLAEVRPTLHAADLASPSAPLRATPNR